MKKGIRYIEFNFNTLRCINSQYESSLDCGIGHAYIDEKEGIHLDDPNILAPVIRPGNDLVKQIFTYAEEDVLYYSDSGVRVRQCLQTDMRFECDNINNQFPFLFNHIENDAMSNDQSNLHSRAGSYEDFAIFKLLSTGKSVFGQRELVFFKKGNASYKQVNKFIRGKSIFDLSAEQSSIFKVLISAAHEMTVQTSCEVTVLHAITKGSSIKKINEFSGMLLNRFPIKGKPLFRIELNGNIEVLCKKENRSEEIPHNDLNSPDR